MSRGRSFALPESEAARPVRLQSAPIFQPMMSFGWLAVIIGLIVYGSLIPFRFHPNTLTASNGYGMMLISWYPSTIEDFLTNLLVYSVFGFVVFLVMRCHQYRTGSAIFYTCLLGILLSVCVESCQSAVGSRIASWFDVASDTIGTFIGSLAAWTLGIVYHRCRVHVHQRFRGYPFSTIALGMTMALAMFHLFPFDFVHNTNQLKTVFLRADWHILAMIQPYYWLAEPQVMMARLVGASWFVILAYCFFFARMEHTHSRHQAMISTLRHGFILIVTIECLQLLTLSHVFESADVIVRCMATMLGVSIALFCSYRSTSEDTKSIRLPHMSKFALCVLVGLQIVVLWISSYNKSQIHSGVTSESTIIPIPFISLWQSSLRVAVGQVMSIIVSYGCLSWSMVALLGRMKLKDAAVISGWLVLFVACRASMLAQGTNIYTLDFTTPIIAVLAHIIVLQLMVYIKLTWSNRMSDETSTRINASSASIVHAPRSYRAYSK